MSLNILYERLARYQSQFVKKMDELANYEAREKELSKIKTDVESACEDNFYIINRHASVTNQCLKAGLVGTVAVVRVGEIIDSHSEEDYYEVGNIPNSLEQIEKELKRVKNRIEALRMEIDSIKWRIQRIYDEIREEERRIEEANRRAAESRRSQNQSSVKKRK